MAEVERPLVCTNEIARNQNSASQPSTLEAKVQWPLSYVANFFDPSFDKNDGLSKEVWVGLE